MKEIDCRGLSYLRIIRELKKYFNSIGEGEAIILVSSELGRSNVIRYATHKGYKVEQDEEDRFNMLVEKRGCLAVEEEESIFSVFISSDKIGNSDEELGEILMMEYFEALNECENLPKEILFLNRGVKLLDKDSKSLESINMLHKKGVAILINDTSIEYYNLKDNITFGEITNMYDMLIVMKKSKKIIKL